MPKKWFDVTGQTFGKLTVLHCNLPPRKRALVKCECDHEFAVGIGSLTSGKTSSCGSASCSSRVKHNLTGQRFGHLFVEKLADKRNDRGDLYWICKCDCGTVKRIRGYHIVSGMDNCGCQTSVRRSLRMRKPIRDSFVKMMFNAYKHGAKSRQIEFTLTSLEFETMMFSQCEYCKVDPYAIHVRTFIDGTSDSLTWNGVDRIDSTQGYTRNNCVPCCKICNAAKSDLTLQEFTSWVSRLTQNFKHTNGEFVNQSHSERVT